MFLKLILFSVCVLYLTSIAESNERWREENEEGSSSVERRRKHRGEEGSSSSSSSAERGLRRKHEGWKEGSSSSSAERGFRKGLEGRGASSSASEESGERRFRKGHKGRRASNEMGFRHGRKRWDRDEEEGSSSSSVESSGERFGRRHQFGGRKHHRRHHRRHHPLRRHGRRHHRRHHGHHHRRPKHHKRHHKRHHKGEGRRFHKGGHRKNKCDRCPSWKKWEESQCLWPGSVNKTSFPESCHLEKLAKHLPKVVSEYYKAKVEEAVSMIEKTFKQRGITKACGFCSRKIACRKREHHSKKHGCKPIEFAFVNEDKCEGTDACQLSVVNGGCPSPVPQEGIEKHNKRIAKFRRHRHGHSEPFSFHGYHFGKELAETKWWHKKHPSVEKSSSNEESSSSEESSASDESSSEENSSSAETPSSAASAENSTENSSEESTEVSPTVDASGNAASNATSAGTRRTTREARHHKKHHKKHHKRHHKKPHRFSPYIPLWHCIKNKQGDKCLCCCGNYFPDVDSGKCVPVKGGNRFPPLGLGFGMA